MKKLISVALVGCMAVSLAACGNASSSTASSTASSAAGETLTGQGQGFGGVITATVTMEGDTSWPVSWEWVYGALEPGVYRLTKSFMDFRDSGDYDTQTYSVEFAIVD